MSNYEIDFWWWIHILHFKYVLPTLSLAWFFFFHIEFRTMCHVSGQFESQSHRKNKTICSFDESRVMLQTFQVFPCSGNFLQWLRVTPSFVTTFPCLLPVCSLFVPCSTLWRIAVGVSCIHSLHILLVPFYFLEYLM